MAILTETDRKAIAHRLFFDGQYKVHIRSDGETADVFEWDADAGSYGWLMDFYSRFEAERWIAEKEEEDE